MSGILLGFIWALIYCAGIILIAFAFVWGFTTVFEKPIDGQVMKWGRILVGLLCFAVLLAWLISALGVAGGFGHFPVR